MCPLLPHNSASAARSVVALPNLTAIRSLPLATGLGLSLTIGLLYPGRTIAQTLSGQESSQLLTAESSVSVASASAQQVLFVSPIVGNDTSADGSQRSPFRSITRALDVAQPNTVILLSPGSYSVETGEVFPLMLKPGVTVQGDPSTQGRGIVIQGGGAFLSSTSAGQNIAILGANQAQLVGVTVTNPNPRGYGVWIESSNPVIASSTFTGNTHDGISTVGNSAPLIRNNRFNGNGANGITVFGQSQPEIRENVFEQTGFAINVAENAAPLIANNQMSRNKVAILAQENARPVLRGNTIESSQQDGVTAIAHAQPNLGTASDPGNNIFRNNPLDLNADASDQVIPAFGNQLAGDRIQGDIDLAGTSLVAAQSTAAIHTAPPQVMRATAPGQPVQTQTPLAQRVQSAEASRATAAITQLPPSTISTMPPSRNVEQSPASVAPASISPVARASSESVRPVPPAVRVSPPTTRPAIVPIVQPRSVAQATVEISVPPPVPAPSPNHELRTAIAPRSQTVSTSPAPQTLSATVPSIAPAQTASPTPAALRPVAASRSNATLRSATAPARPTSARSTSSNSTSSNATFNAPIEIPVPVATRPTPTPLAYAPRSAATFNAPIEIPVPPPESSAVAPAAVSDQAPTPPRTSGAAPSANLLPVPSGDVPVGNVGDLPRINVASTQVGGMYFASQIRANLRYRVVVDASSEDTQSLVQSIIPNAFFTSVNGQRLMQVGAFNSRDNAEQTVLMLNQNGLVAVIQEIK